MKRIHPQAGTGEDEHAYPSLEDVQTGRRGFLRQTLGWAAGAGTVWLLDRFVTDSTASAGTAKLKAKNGWYQVTVELPPFPQVTGASYAVCRIVVQTRSKAFARFLLQETELKGIRKVALARLKGVTVQDVTNRKKLAQLRSRLATTLLKHYKKRTKRRVARPIVTLGIAARYRCRPHRRMNRWMGEAPTF